MSLDKATAARLWDQRYRKFLESYSIKNKYLDPEGMDDPQNLFSDLAMNVFVKAVNAFDADKVTYSKDVDRSFNAFFTQILGQYTSNLAEHRNTGKQQYFRKNKRSIDQPAPGSDDEEGATLLDMLESHGHDTQLQTELKDVLSKLPPDLAAPVQYIVENLDRGDTKEVMQAVRDKWGFTQTRLFNALADQPAWADFVSTI
jgi:hypothetical protein